MWPGGVSTGMLSNSFAVVRASLPSTPVLRVFCRKRNGAPLCSSKLSQKGLALQFVLFSPSWICVNMKREKEWQLYPSEEPGEPDTLQNISDKRTVCDFCISFTIFCGQTVHGYVAILFLPFVFWNIHSNNKMYDTGSPIKNTEIWSRWCLIWLKTVKLDGKHFLNNCHEMLEDGPRWWNLLY